MTAALFITVLSIVDRVLLRPLPYARADRLVMIRPAAHTVTAFDYTAYAGYPNIGLGGASLRRAFTTAIKESATSIEDVAFATGGSLPSLVAAFDDQPVAFQGASFNLLQTIGVRPIAGRDFTEADARTAYGKAVIISYELWTSRFGRSQEVLERPGRP
jgi:putative ABC transport system permease protein